mmetsp:Transcript_77744/g.209564  ORF Transcript_77744/g.209564 Transcript_77744/m.209564 type:complete len:91 (+) Transcript_77744:33-305(+)
MENAEHQVAVEFCRRRVRQNCAQKGHAYACHGKRFRRCAGGGGGVWWEGNGKGTCWEGLLVKRTAGIQGLSELLQLGVVDDKHADLSVLV